MKRRVITILIILILSAFLYQYLAYKDTDSLVTDFLDVVTLNEKSNVDYGKLEIFHMDMHGDVKVEKVEAKLERQGVYHNFKKGIILARIDITWKDAEGNVLNRWTADQDWYIEKRNGRWIVYDMTNTV